MNLCKSECLTRHGLGAWGGVTVSMTGCKYAACSFASAIFKLQRIAITPIMPPVAALGFRLR